jgi:chemotaxis protein CheZ
MPVQRKVFSIEQHVRSRIRGSAQATSAGGEQHREFTSGLRALRSPVEPKVAAESDVGKRASAQIAEAQAYKAELTTIYDAIGRTAADMASLMAGAKSGAQASRISRELAAIVTGTERATQAILQAAEEIDQSAHALAAALKNHERGLVHDIQERVVQIFEVCNFQDLTGQRVSKAVTTLRFIEEHIDRMLEIWQKVEQFRPIAPNDRNEDDEQRFLNGPKLAGDGGHSTQSEIDKIFVRG